MPKNIFDSIPTDGGTATLDAPASKNVFDSIPADSAPASAALIPKIQATPSNQPSQFSSGYGNTVPISENPDYDLTRAITDPNTGLIAKANKGVGYAGNVARGVVTDAAMSLVDPFNTTKQIPSGNTAAALRGDTLPQDETLKGISGTNPTTATAGKIAQGLLGTTPLLAAGGLPELGQKLVSLGFSADMISKAPQLATDIGTELGKNPQDRDADKLTSLISDAIQTGLFAPLAGAHGLSRSKTPSEPPQNAPNINSVDAGTVVPPAPPAEIPTVKDSSTVQNPNEEVISPSNPPPLDTPAAPPKAAPPAEPNAAAPAVAEKPVLTPALRDGDKVLSGGGNKHDEVMLAHMNEMPPEEQGDFLARNGDDNVERGFVDQNGKFYSRDEAKATGVFGDKAPMSENLPDYTPNAEPPPVKVSELKLAEAPSDFDRYKELTSSLKGKSLDAAQPILKEIEAIKNRNGGNPPVENLAPPATSGLAEPIASLQPAKSALRDSGSEAPLPEGTPTPTPENAGSVPTSLKNATADVERAANGLPEANPTQKRAMGAAWEQSGEVLKNDPTAGQRIADEVIHNPERGVNDSESALLLRQKVAMGNALRASAEKINDGDVNEKSNFDRLSNQFKELLDAIKSRGSEWGREGRWRQALAYEDFSFQSREQILRAKKGGAPLTDAERETLLKQTAEHEKIIESQRKLIEEKSDRVSELELKSALDKIAFESRSSKSQKTRTTTAPWLSTLKADADAARNRLSKAGGKLYAAGDVKQVLSSLKDEITIGAYHAARIGADISNWTKKNLDDWTAAMKKELGDKISPHLAAILEAAKKTVTEAAAKSSDESRLKALKTRLDKRIEELEGKLKSSDFSKKPKRPIPAIDAEARALQVRKAKLEDDIKTAELKAERAGRNKFQKLTGAISNLNRVSILSHLSVLEHLSGAAIENIFTRPIGTALAQVSRLNGTLDAIRKKAIYEGNASIRSEFKGITGLLKSSKALKDKLFTGSSELDWLHKGVKYPKEFLQIVQNVHGAIKEPVRQSIYARSMQLRTEAAEKMGLDPARDEVLSKALSSEAYADANMDIFMGDNFLSKALHGVVTGYLRGEKSSPGLAKFTADVLDILFPIVNVSTNLAIRKYRLLAGLPEAATRIGISASRGELKNGAEKLTPLEAERITRAMKYGLFGIALGTYAWYHPQYFGGIYVTGKQAPTDKKTGLKTGEIALPDGGHISHHLAHGPVGGYMNLMADARRLYEKDVKDNPNNKWSALSDAAFFSMYAGTKDLPAFATMGRLTSPFKTAGQKLGELVKNIFVAGAVQDVAEGTDKNQRSPKNFEQEIAVGIPGLRQTVPTKKAGKNESYQPPMKQ